MRRPAWLGGWSDDPLWGHVYDWIVEHRGVGGLLWRTGLNSDLRLLYEATAEIGRQEAGSAVLDIPCGGGVALRGLRAGQGVRYVAADISAKMLQRTRTAAAERGVAAQVEPVVADVHDLQFDDGEFDLVVSFTGLHCFPEPHRAVLELGRVTAPGGRLTGSTLLEDAGLRYAHIFAAGRLGGVLGPGCTSAQLLDWLAEAGFTDVTLHRSGALGYFRGVRA